MQNYIKNTQLALILVLCAMLSVFQSCDNTLEVNADWKEIAVVYGLLNPTDPVNYIRINKVYMNPQGDAISIAGISDSLYFDSLDVKVVEFLNGVEKRVFTLSKVNGNDIGIPKDSGIFASEVNYLYRLDANLKESNLRDTYKYQVIIVNKFTGKVVRSQFDMIGQMDLLSPLKPINPELDIPIETNRSIVFKYREGRFAKMYDAIMTFYYVEMDKTDTTIMKRDSVNWLLFSGRETVSLRGYDENVVIVNSSLFYDNLLSKMKENPSVKRRAESLSIQFYGGGEDLYTYIEVNKPSLGIVQKKPEFTNIEGGLGLFSSRYIDRISGITLDPQTIDRLVLSEKLKPLGFVY